MIQRVVQKTENEFRDRHKNKSSTLVSNLTDMQVTLGHDVRVKAVLREPTNSSGLRFATRYQKLPFECFDIKREADLILKDGDEKVIFVKRKLKVMNAILQMEWIQFFSEAPPKNHSGFQNVLLLQWFSDVGTEAKKLGQERVKDWSLGKNWLGRIMNNFMV